MFKSIVWANDGSESAERALPYVKEQAHAGGATVTLVHVVERIEGSGAVGAPRRVDEAQVQAHMQELVDELGREGIPASLEIRGDVGARPAHEVAEIARATGADLIVVGSLGHSAIHGFLVGSVTNRILHLAPCPVRVVPPKRQ